MIKQFLNISEKFPSKIFLYYKNKYYSYDQIKNKIINSALIINQNKIKANSLIGLQLSNPLEFIINWFACNYLGLISVLINPKIKANELKLTYDSIFFKYLITSKDNYINELTNINLIYNHNSSSISNHENWINPKIWEETDTITIILTSGSSEKQKPVELSTKNFLASFNNWNNKIKFTNYDKILNILPLYHIAGFSSIIRGLISNRPIHLYNNFKINNLISKVSLQKNIIISLVPTIIYKCLINDKGIKFLQSFKMILVGGGSIDPQLLEKCIINNINIFITYGLTETCSGITGFWIKNNPNKLKSVGKPFDNVNISTTAQNKEYSNINIQGDNISNGYWNQARLNSKFITDDLGKFDTDGFLYLKPHTKNKIVTGGENVNPVEIELVIQKYPNIIDCCVIGFKNKKWGEEIIAFIHTNKNIIYDDLIKYCKNYLLEFKIPKRFIKCNEIPKNELGKINRLKAEKILKDHGHI